MKLIEFRSHLVDAKEEAKRLVDAINQHFKGIGQPEPISSWPGSHFSSDQKLQKAFAENAFKLRRVSRITGEPYAVHPTRMALMAMKIFPESEAPLIARYALFHDYLEEGDGVNPEGLRTFLVEAPGWDEATYHAAVFLSEPDLKLANHDELVNLGKTAEDLALLKQVKWVVREGANEALVAANLLDKLDNLHDLDYILGNKRFSEEKKHAKLTKKLAFFSLASEELGQGSYKVLADLLAEGVMAVGAENRISLDAIGAMRSHFLELAQHFEFAIEQAITTHLDAMGCSSALKSKKVGP